MIGFLYTVLACVIGALNAGALVMDGQKYGHSFAEGIAVAAIVRIAIAIFLED